MADLQKRKAVQKPRAKFPLVWLFGGAALLIVIGIGVWFWSATAESGPGKLGPRLSVNTEKLDFGDVKLDKTVRAEFVLTNAGDRTLTLDTSTPVRVVEGC
ncbi:MAG TPA: hypothetical protein VIX58_06475 [Anaerolineae bacterium]